MDTDNHPLIITGYETFNDAVSRYYNDFKKIDLSVETEDEYNVSMEGENARRIKEIYDAIIAIRDDKELLRKLFDVG